eukprot:gene49101-19395_t
MRRAAVEMNLKGHTVGGARLHGPHPSYSPPLLYDPAPDSPHPAAG